MKDRELEPTRRAFLGTATLGALVTGALCGKAEAAEWTPSEKANVQIVTDFCAAWSTRDMAKPLAFLSADCVYRMSETTPPANGHEGVMQRLKSYVDATDRLEFEVLETFAAGPIVINRRVDKFISTTRPITWEGIGVFFMQGGKIKEWSDYTTRVSR